MARFPATDQGSGASAFDGAGSESAGASAFHRELQRARRHLARLEAEQQARTGRSSAGLEPAVFDESPAFVRTCNLLICAIVLLPVALAVIALVRRLAG